MVRGGRRIGSALALVSLLGCCGLLPPAPNLGRRSRWALGVLSLLAGAVLLPPAPAEAQTTVNVSNISQTSSGNIGATRGEAKTRFATGGTTGGTTSARYTLSNVTIPAGSSIGGGLDASIYNASGSDPGNLVGNLACGNLGANTSNVTCTASSVTLSGNTTYFLSLRLSSGSLFTVTKTTSNDEDTGSTTGWSIADAARRSTNSGTTWIALGGGSVNDSLRFTVNATTTTLNATLSAVTLDPTSGRLELGYTGATFPWWYKKTSPPPAGSSCTSAGVFPRDYLTSLSAGTSYTYKAYSDSGCTTEIGSTTFLQAELRGRGLLTHAAEGFRDQGFSGSLSWQQRPDSDLGAMLSLSQTMGGSSSGGADALLSRVNLEGLAANDDEGNGLQHQRTDLQIRYGFLAFGDRFTLTPELGLSL